MPIYEIGLDKIIERNQQEARLTFSSDLNESIRESQVIFIAVGTPSLSNGLADLSQVEEVARTIALNLDDYKVIVNKSTVPVGTGKLVRDIITSRMKKDVSFDIVSNPEFLREGTAIQDFTHPDRIVIGTESERSREIMFNVYKSLYLIDTPFIFTTLETAELIKYASNAFLATKITFINEMANLCEAVGGDIQTLAKAMGLDGRIGPKFLHAGPGYGGSCFPKDTKAIVKIAESHGEELSIIKAVIKANDNQRLRMIPKIKRNLGFLRGKIIAILGLAFKQNTDDMREAPSITIINGLLAEGALVKVHDPVAINEAMGIFGEKVDYYKNAYDAAEGADAVVIVTEWNSYRRLDLNRLKLLMKNPLLIDLRNLYTPQEAIEAGFQYEGVGRGVKNLNNIDEAALSRE